MSHKMLMQGIEALRIHTEDMGRRYDKVQKENEVLRKDNRMLRRLLVEKVQKKYPYLVADREKEIAVMLSEEA